MTFLNIALLGGLVFVAVPILIHLLNRRKPKLLDWGAMRFLKASLAVRSRRLLVEEIILLVLRCLVVALIVLAMARPFLPSWSAIPWVLILPGTLAAAVCAGIAAALWSDAPARRNLLRAAGILIAVSLILAAAEKWLQRRRWGGGRDAQDVVIIVDASMSMTIRSDGRSNFERAVAEAQSVVKSLRPTDTVGLILAGPVPRVFGRKPSSDRTETLKLLRSPDFQPLGGSMGVLEALNGAAALLADTRNPDKRIILITDGQNAGWDAQSEGRWRFIADSLKTFHVPPRIVCLRLPLPRVFRNASLTDVSLSRTVLGRDWPVRIEARILNAGTTPVQPSAVDLWVDGTNVAREVLVKELAPGSAETVRFDHRFSVPGRHVIRAQVVCDDSLTADNATDWVVDVLDRLPVLIVDGAPSDRLLDSASGFVKIALSPSADAASSNMTSQAPTPGLVEARTVSAATMATGSVDEAGVVILANVPKLPAAVTERLSRHVKEGRGLLIAPGARGDPAFYNEWRTAAGEPLAPAGLAERRAAPENPARLELKTFVHPALRLVADAEQSDAGSALIRSWWKLAVAGHDPAVRVSGALDNGDPFLVERQLGKGYILMATLALDRTDSSLPSLKCFVPLVHELVYYLAAPSLPVANVRPGTELALEMSGPITNLLAIGQAAGSADPSLQILTPSQRRRPATLAVRDGRQILRFSETYEPGLYRVVPARSAESTNPVAPAGIPFAVLGQPEESSLNPLSEAEAALIRGQVEMLITDRSEDLFTALGGGVPGQEMWKWLVICALVGLLAEIALTRWIALRRRFHAAETVSLRSPAKDTQAFRDRARELLGKRGA